MSSFPITDPKVLKFIKENPQLDFNQLCNTFIDIIEKIKFNLSEQIDDSQNNKLLQNLLLKIEGLEDNQSQHIQTNLDMLTQNMRDMIKANNHDNEKTIISLITQNNELFINKIDSLSNNDSLHQYISSELKRINESIISETARVNLSENQIIERINLLFQHKYSELEKTIQTRLECNASTQNTNFTNILSRLDHNTVTMNLVDEYFHKQIGSTNKGKMGETRLELLLSELYPSALIKNTSGSTACGDFIIERKEKHKILIDTKDYDTCVPPKEVEKILRDMEQNAAHGILISQNSGISQKNDFEINIHNKFIVIFIHNALYDPAKIKLAINIIDHLEPILLSKEESTETISSEVLSLINKEYQTLVMSKLNLIHSIKHDMNKHITQIQKIDLPSLTLFLNNKFANTGKTAFPCERCHKFSGKNAKSLAAHQRKCKGTINIETTVSQ